jgi:Domain of unknown function (DUF4263)
MKEIKTSKDGIDYLNGVLLEKALTVTRAMLWKIEHHKKENNEICLKIGRYKKKKGPFNLTPEELEHSVPKSELTLEGEEFLGLIDFIEKNYEPFSKGVQKFISLDQKFEAENVKNLQSFFEHPEKKELIDFLLGHNIIPNELFIAFNQLTKSRAIEKFEKMLEDDLTEHDWQKWFQDNDWVLGTEYVRILDERKIDTENITDFLMEAYDGFLDIIEIKRPDGKLNFWSSTKDHENNIPHQDLIRAITQATKYIYEIEREADSIKFRERVNGIKTIKPRCVLIYGRSDDWDDEKKEDFRILNSNYHNLSIMTYDHVLERAKRMLK